jgi:geranylgeranylglycerol-phosphate geranylgeranyltransferase
MVTTYEKLRGVVRLFRPELPFAAGVCVVVGEILALAGFPPHRTWSRGFHCGFFISGSALILNDYFDLEVDRVNAPERPLPSGTVSPAESVVLALVTMLLGLGAGFAFGLPALLICLFFGLVGFLYNWRFKSSGLPGNLMVAASVAITFILGGVVAGVPWHGTVWFFALIAFLIDLGEEVAGDAMDAEGDRRRGSRSIAILRGRDAALRVSGLVFALVVLVSPIPILMGWLGRGYLAMIVIADAALVFFTVRLLKSRTPEEGCRAMRGIYLGPLLGLLAFIVGNWFL